MTHSILRKKEPFMILCIIISLSTSILSQDSNTEDLQTVETTPEDRVAMLQEITDMTMRVRPWSPTKPEDVSTKDTYREKAMELHDEFYNADTDKKLACALNKLSNLRRDTHCKIKEILDGPGIKVDKTETETILRFAPDFTAGEDETYFLKDFASEGTDILPDNLDLGARLIKVNGMELEDYLEILEPNLRYSTNNLKRWKVAEYLSTKSELFDPALYAPDNKVTYTFMVDHRDVEVELTYSLDKRDYRRNSSSKWQRIGYPPFYGFERLIATDTYELWKYKTEPEVLLINWFHFDNTEANAEDIIEYCDQNDLLDYDLIFYAPFSSGGSGCPELLRRLTPLSFKVTYGNIKITELTQPFLDDSQSWQVRKSWVTEAIDNGDEFTTDAPYRYLDNNIDEITGMMPPAETTFTGNVVCVFSSLGGSNLDQFNAMVKDNGLFVTIGYPTGGFSKSWTFLQPVQCGGKDILNYSWIMGQNKRPPLPTGEVLEGNPAEPSIKIPYTRQNFLTYWEDMVDEAWSELAKERDCTTGMLRSKSYNRYLDTDNHHRLITTEVGSPWTIDILSYMKGHTTHFGFVPGARVVNISDPDNGKFISCKNGSELKTLNQDTETETWEMIPMGNNEYKFHNRYSDRYWDADGASQDYRVEGQTHAHEDDEIWDLECQEIPRLATIRNFQNRYFLHPNGSDVEFDDKEYKWRFYYEGYSDDGYVIVRIKDLASDKYLKYDGGFHHTVSLSSHHHDSYSKWTLEYAGGDKTLISNVHTSSRYLKLVNDGSVQGVTLPSGDNYHGGFLWQID